MSVIQVQQKKGNNTLGTLGTLATMAGMATGQPWLTALGTLGSTANSLMNGSEVSATQATDAGNGLSDLLKGMKNWFNPAKTEKEQAEEEVADLMKRWGYLNGGSSFANGWGTGLQPNGSYIMI